METPFPATKYRFTNRVEQKAWQDEAIRKLEEFVVEGSPTVGEKGYYPSGTTINVSYKARPSDLTQQRDSGRMTLADFEGRMLCLTHPPLYVIDWLRRYVIDGAKQQQEKERQQQNTVDKGQMPPPPPPAPGRGRGRDTAPVGSYKAASAPYQNKRTTSEPYHHVSQGSSGNARASSQTYETNPWWNQDSGARGSGDRDWDDDQWDDNKDGQGWSRKIRRDWDDPAGYPSKEQKTYHETKDDEAAIVPYVSESKASIVELAQYRVPYVPLLIMIEMTKKYRTSKFKAICHESINLKIY